MFAESLRHYSRAFQGAPPLVSDVSRRGGRVVMVVRVAGTSMQPTLRPGDVLLVGSPTRARVGDVVIVDLPGERPRAVKRLVRRLPEGWWVERDNPMAGVDSWAVGAVPGEGQIGRVIGRLWPRPRFRL